MDVDRLGELIECRTGEDLEKVTDGSRTGSDVYTKAPLERCDDVTDEGE